jgi:hypothetical protein
LSRKGIPARLVRREELDLPVLRDLKALRAIRATEVTRAIRATPERLARREPTAAA